MLISVLNGKCIAGFISLVPFHLALPHIFIACAPNLPLQWLLSVRFLNFIFHEVT